MSGAGRTARAVGTLATALVLLLALALTAVASTKPGALDRGFGAAGRVATQASLGGSYWTAAADVQMARGPEGTILSASGGTVFRYLPDGGLDPSFGEGGKLVAVGPEGRPLSINDMVIDPEGRVTLFGAVTLAELHVPVSYIGTTVSPQLAAIARYDRSGKPDLGFDGDGFLVTDFGLPAYAPGHYDSAFVSLIGGTLDREGGLIAIVGSVTLAGHCSRYAATESRAIVRLTPAGALDLSFSDDGIQADTGFARIDDVAIAGDELVLVGTNEDPCRKLADYAVAQLLTDGTPDASFGRNGFRSHSLGPISDLAVDRAGGLLLLAGPNLLRLTSRGKVDRRFGDRGIAYVRLPGASSLSSIAIEPSGRIVLAGTQVLAKAAEKPAGNPYRRSFTVLRLTPSGKSDRGFGHHGWVATRFGKRSSASASEAFVDQTGRLVVGGAIASPDLAPTGGIALARYLLGR